MIFATVGAGEIGFDAALQRVGWDEHSKSQHPTIEKYPKRSPIGVLSDGYWGAQKAFTPTLLDHKLP
jgi:hypothetical protein